MKVPVTFRVVSRQANLSKAPAILSRNLRGGLEAVGKRLQTSARTRMRQDTGAEQRSLKYRVSGAQLNLNVLVVSSLVEAFVDAYGMRRGTFPNFEVNSKLYNWAKRRLRGLPTKQVKTIGTPHGPRQRKRIQIVKHIRPVANVHLTANARARAKHNDTKRLAFLVARAIYRRGREGTMWHTKTLEANKGRIIREMTNALIRAANELKRSAA